MQRSRHRVEEFKNIAKVSNRSKQSSQVQLVSKKGYHKHRGTGLGTLNEVLPGPFTNLIAGGM